MEESQETQTFAKKLSITPTKPVIPKIDISGLSPTPQKPLLIKKNIRQFSDFSHSKTPSSNLLNRSEDKVKKRLQKCASNDIMSKSAQFSDTTHINHENESKSGSQSPLDFRKSGNTFLKDQIEEQKRFKIKEEIQKQIAQQQKKIEKLQSKSSQNYQVLEEVNDGSQKGLNLNQYLKKQDTLFEQKRSFIKQKLAEIGFEDTKKMVFNKTYSSKIFMNKSKKMEAPKILIDGKANPQANSQGGSTLKNISYRNSIKIGNLQHLGIDSSQDQSVKNISINGSLEEQYEQEENKLQRTTKEVYFSSVMDPGIMSIQETIPNQHLVPIRKRIPQISPDPNMNLALAVLINKTKEQRNQEDIATLMRATKQIPFFNKIESKVLLYQSLCKSMQYQYVPKGGIVFYYGDFPDRFYITLKGKVSILIPKKPEDILKEDLVSKEMKSQQQLMFTIHKRFLYRSLHRVYKRLCNILYFILILKVKANILQKLPTQLAFKSKVDFTLNSLPEGANEDSDESSCNIPRNHSFVLQTEQNVDDQKVQKSKAELSQMNDFMDNEIDRAMKGIRQQNQEKKFIFKQKNSSYSNLKADNSRIRNSNITDVSSVSFQIPNSTAQDNKALNNSQLKYSSKPRNEAKNHPQLDIQDINDAQSVGITKATTQQSHFSGGQQNNKFMPLSHMVDSIKTQQSQQSGGEKKKREYQPIQPPQSYFDQIINLQSISQQGLVQTAKENNQEEEILFGLPNQLKKEISNQSNDDFGSSREFRQPVDKYKDMMLSKIIADESQDPMYNSNQLYIAKLDQEMKDIRRPSQLNINLAGQVENIQLAQKLQNASQTASRRRSVLKIAIDAFVNTSNQNTFKLYQEKKKLIEQAVKGLDLEKLENGAHFFKNNTFKYNHAFTSGDGLVFGELGILNKKPRAATIVCLEDCYFGYLSSQNYQQILMKKEKTSLIKKREFIESTLMQNQLSGEKMSKVSYYFHKRKYQSGEIVFKEGDTTSYIYLIKKGEIELQKEEEVITNDTELSKVTIRVAKLSSREYFGDCDIYFNRKRKYTAVVTQESVIYFCEKGQFVKQLEEIKEFWDKYGERIQIKEDYRNQQIEESKKTRNFEKNLRKFSSPKKRIRHMQQVNHQQQQQQKMDSIISGVPIAQNDHHIDDHLTQATATKHHQFSSVQTSPRQNLENEFEDTATRTDRILMAKSVLFTPHQRRQNLSQMQNAHEPYHQSQQKIQAEKHNYNLEKTNNSQEDNQIFYSPEKIKAQHKAQTENNGHTSDRNYTSSSIKDGSKAFLFSFKDLQECNTDRISTNRLQTPLTKRDVKNIYAPIYSAKDLVIEDEVQQIQKLTESNVLNGQITFRSNQNNGNGLTTSRSYGNSGQMTSNRQFPQIDQQYTDITATTGPSRQEKIAGQIALNAQQEIQIQKNQQNEQLQGLREEFFSGTEALRRLKKDIKINKELLKKGTKHQKKISAHDQYKITKEVCMQNDEIYQREQRVNQKKNKILQIEQETGIRKQMHHSKKGSEICSIYSKLSSMDDKVTFSNAHSLEPEVVVQSPLFSRNNSNSDIYVNHMLVSKPDSIKDFSSSSSPFQPFALQEQLIQKNASIFLREGIQSQVTEDTAKITQGFQTTITNSNNSPNLLPLLITTRENQSILKRGQSTTNFTSTGPASLIKTSQYFLLQEKGFNGDINKIHRDSQSRTLSNKRNYRPHQQNNIEANTSTNENQRSASNMIKHRHTLSSNTSKPNFQAFLPIHSEKLFTASSNSTKNIENVPNYSIQSTLVKKLSSKDLSNQFKNNNIHSRVHQNFQSVSINPSKTITEPKQMTLQQKLINNVRQQSSVQVQVDKQLVGSQICFDDNQVEKIPIKRFDFKKNYVNSNKITILNHMQKPMLFKSN